MGPQHFELEMALSYWGEHEKEDIIDSDSFDKHNQCHEYDQDLRIKTERICEGYYADDFTPVAQASYDYTTQPLRPPGRAFMLPDSSARSHVQPSDVIICGDMNMIKTSSTPLEEKEYWEQYQWHEMSTSESSTPFTPYSSYQVPPFTPHFTHLEEQQHSSPLEETIYSDLDTGCAHKADSIALGKGSQLNSTQLDFVCPDANEERLWRISQKIKDLDADEAHAGLSDKLLNTDISSLLENPAQQVFMGQQQEPATLIRKRNQTPKAERKHKLEVIDLSANAEEGREHVSVVQALRNNPTVWNSIKERRKKGNYKCGHCTAIFTTMFQLAEHIDEYKIKRAYRCLDNNCPWSILGLPRRAEVRRHCAAQHAYVVETSAISPNCGSLSPISEPWLFTQAEKFPCSSPLCRKLFKRRDARQRHEKLVHMNTESRFNKRVDKLRVKYVTNDIAELAKLMESNKPLPRKS